MFSAILATLKDPRLPAIDQNIVQFHNTVVIDAEFDGTAFANQGERCATVLSDPSKKVMIMDNHGVMILGSNVADAFNRLFYFERSAETDISALQTGKELSTLSDSVAEKTARQWEAYHESADMHFNDLELILDRDEPDSKL